MLSYSSLYVNPRVLVEQMSEPVMVSCVRLPAAVGLYSGVHTYFISIFATANRNDLN